jgi:Domain of unknown function (DUF4386)
MEPQRQRARIAGVWFVLTFVFSIPAVILYQPLLKHADYIIGGGADKRIFAGALLEILLVIANIATAVVLFPILKRQSESIALGYVTCRVIESSIIVVGIVSVLSVVKLRQDIGGVSAAAASLDTVGRSLVAFHDWTFLLGPQFCAGLGNGLLLGYLMYTSELVPRRMALLGLIGGPLAFLAGTLVLFGAFDAGSAPLFLMTIPEIAWEASLGIYLIVKGFRPSSPLLVDDRRLLVEPTPAISAA